MSKYSEVGARRRARICEAIVEATGAELPWEWSSVELMRQLTPVRFERLLEHLLDGFRDRDMLERWALRFEHEAADLVAKDYWERVTQA